MKITQCKVNHMENPTGYQYRHLTFSWIADCRGSLESRIVISSAGQVVKDTGWAKLDMAATTLDVELKPRTRYEWTVAVRNEKGESITSDVNYFETGKMQEPWTAQWITTTGANDRHPIFYHTLPDGADKKVTKARLYICGLGLYEAYLDGVKIGADWLTPGFNAYHLWVQTQTYDVTEMMQSRPKELSILAGDGWYKSRIPFEGSSVGFYGNDYRVLAELHMEYEDGSKEVLSTDESWQVRRSNITFSGIYDGEWQDDTLPQGDVEAVAIATPLKGQLIDRLSVPVRTHEEFHPVLVPNDAGETILDIGQNLAGIFTLRVHIPKGQRVHIQAGEVLQDGHFYRDNLRTAKAEFYYTSDGEEHIVRPHFTFYGFRYLKIEGIENFDPKDITVYALYSDMPMNSQLKTGHAKLNQFLSNVSWGMKSNFVDLPTDCPQRDERMGWTGDSQVFSETACFLAQPYAFYRKYLYDMEQEQKNADGCAPDFVPAVTCSGKGTTAWGDATTIMPWNMYLYTGDITILQEHFESMCGWVDYITKVDGTDHGWRRQFHYGDWLALDCPYEGDSQVRGGTDEGFIADTYYRKSALITARTARLLGKEDIAVKYETLADKILTDIVAEYYSPNGRCCINTQTAALLTLHEGLNRQDRALQQLLTLLENADDKLKTGFVGTPLLCEELADHGQEKLADKLLLNEEYPGWLHEVNLGATTVWERWNSLDESGHISSTGMNSLNHYAYGAVAAYIWKRLVGLNPVEDAPGFHKVQIIPHVNYSIGSIQAVYPSPVGEYRIAWETLDLNHVHFTVSVPPQGEAYVVLPKDKQNRTFTLQGETLDITYETDGAIGVHRSLMDNLQVLIRNPRCRAILQKEVPDLDWMLGFARENPLQETLKNRKYTEEKIEQIGKRISEIVE